MTSENLHLLHKETFGALVRTERRDGLVETGRQVDAGVQRVGLLIARAGKVGTSTEVDLMFNVINL